MFSIASTFPSGSSDSTPADASRKSRVHVLPILFVKFRLGGGSCEFVPACYAIAKAVHLDQERAQRHDAQFNLDRLVGFS